MAVLRFFLMMMMLFAALCYLHAQPAIFNYQAVLRDDAGEVLASEEVTVVVIIRQGSPDGQQVFAETHHTQTNDFGVINLQIGSIESLGGIDWSAGIYFIEISVDGMVMGVSQLLSVPYAIHSQTSADVFGGNYEDLENLPDLDNFVALADPEYGDMIVYSEDSWQRIPPGSEGQVLTVKNGIPQWQDVPESDPGDEHGTVTDIDGNTYPTIILNGREWMAENLRTTRYADGTVIPSGLTDGQWGNTGTGAFAIYPHALIDGLHSPDEVVEAYGHLYNWYAVDDARGLCPAGWYVPSHNEWTEFEDYLITTYNLVNEPNVVDGLGSALKSCRQVNSPIGGECVTDQHPRWNAHSIHHGHDLVEFATLPAGRRRLNGVFFDVGHMGFFWTSTSHTTTHAINRTLFSDAGHIAGFFSMNYRKTVGYSVRCIRETD